VQCSVDSASRLVVSCDGCLVGAIPQSHIDWAWKDRTRSSLAATSYLTSGAAAFPVPEILMHRGHVRMFEVLGGRPRMPSLRSKPAYKMQRDSCSSLTSNTTNTIAVSASFHSSKHTLLSTLPLTPVRVHTCYQLQTPHTTKTHAAHFTPVIV